MSLRSFPSTDRGADGDFASPAAPLPTSGFLKAACTTALFAMVLLYLFVDVLGHGLGPTGVAFLGALGVVLLLPLWAAYLGRRRSRTAWAGNAHVEARVLAARSRRMSISSLGLSVFVSIASLIGLLIFLNDGAVQKTFFDVGFMAESTGDVLRALSVNIEIAVSAQIIAMIFGLLLAVGRLLPARGFWPIRFLAIAYIDAFRGIPAVVLIYLVCFGVPLTGVPILSGGSVTLYAIVALSMTYSAYNAELYRAGIEAIGSEQRISAESLGLTQADVLRFVIFPQMIQNIMPPMLNLFIALQKDTALVIVVGIIDAFSQAKIYSATNFNLSSVTMVCIIFLLLTFPQTRLLDYLMERTRRNRV